MQIRPLRSKKTMPYNHRNGTGPRRSKGLVLKQRALEMRIAGASYQMIGDEIGVSKQSCQGVVSRALKGLVRENVALAEELRQLTCTRFDAMILALWEKALDGDVAAVGEIRRIEETRHRILGTMLDSRFAFDTKVTIGETNTFTEIARQKLKQLVSGDSKVIDAVFDNADANNATG